ncbi:MAG: flagellar basal-body rod protein FlgF [Spongiibacteraceae bacterium]|nr:flagellar basal-body rod protein FlgF [Spongiibacteraceae bacterium]
MDKAIYIAMTGAKHFAYAQSVHANNLANAATGGFKADMVQARSQGVYYGDGFSSRAYALSETPATNFAAGPLNETGRDLDIAVDGDGWIAVQAPDGSEAYTRAGSLRLDPFGQLLTAQGHPVLGEGGPISVPPAAKLDIGSDGTITIQPLGQGAALLTQVDRIKLVNPEPGSLHKGADGLIRSDGAAVLPADGALRVQTGFLEGSNVDPVEALTGIIALARQFEMQVKLMSSADEQSASASRLLQQL